MSPRAAVVLSVGIRKPFFDEALDRSCDFQSVRPQSTTSARCCAGMPRSARYENGRPPRSTGSGRLPGEGPALTLAGLALAVVLALLLLAVAAVVLAAILTLLLLALGAAHTALLAVAGITLALAVLLLLARASARTALLAAILAALLLLALLAAAALGLASLGRAAGALLVLIAVLIVVSHITLPLFSVAPVGWTGWRQNDPERVVVPAK
jgi:hypothetical protein